MNYSEDGYVAMLLTMALSPDREEYARPYNMQEFHQIVEAVRGTEFKRVGKLLNVDISGLMMYLHMSEAEAYRTFTLLHRSVQLVYALESLEKRGIEAITCFDDSFPRRIQRKLKDHAPAFYYRCGSDAILSQPAIAILGVSGIRTDDAVRGAVRMLVQNAIERGYTIVTGGEPGVSRFAATEATASGGTVLEVLGGELGKIIENDDVAEMIALERTTLITLEHPDAMFTFSHATARNRLLYALSDAAFVFSSDSRRSELEAIQDSGCDWVYAWSGCPENRSLIAHGAIALNDLNSIDFDEMSRHWNSSNAEQLDIFDLL